MNKTTESLDFMTCKSCWWFRRIGKSSTGKCRRNFHLLAPYPIKSENEWCSDHAHVDTPNGNKGENNA